MENRNRNTQIGILFISHLAILFSGMGLFPILPLYAAEFEVGPGMIGLYLSITSLSITAGNLLPGWLPGSVSRKALFIASGLAGIPALILMGYAARFWQLVLLTGIIWFIGGVGISLVQVLTGLYAAKANRGKSFGIQSLATPLGALLGGTAVGVLIDTSGYRTMFVVLAVVWSVWPLLAALFLKIPAPDSTAVRKADASSRAKGSHSPAGQQAFVLILMAVLLTAFTISVGRLGLSLSMKELHFSPSEISSTSVIGGLFGIPLLLAMSASADRLSARFFMIVGFLSAAAAALVILFTADIRYFQAASVLLMLSQSVNRSMSYSLAAETISSAEFGRKLPWMGTANWAANIAGFASVGPGLAVLGTEVFYLAIAGLPLLSTLLVWVAAPAHAFPSLERLLARIRHIEARSPAGCE